jgi:hypothetical protein
MYIGGHSNATGDLMYSKNNSRNDKAIASRDLNTLITAYCGDFGNRSRGIEDDVVTGGEYVDEKIVCGTDHINLPNSSGVAGELQIISLE